MHISFNGFLAPHTYNCPHACYLRNIAKKFLNRSKFEEELSEEEISKRRFGIEQHELVDQYISGALKEYEYTTDTIEWYKEHGAVTEEQAYYNMDFVEIANKPEKIDFISTRKDAVVREDVTYIADWKFGNPEYGSAKYYDETEFFLAMDSMQNPATSAWEVHVHFPVHDYTLPIRKYDVNQVSRLQQKTISRIDNIMNTNFFKANPGRQRCRFCDYRSEDTGGSGDCEFTVV